MNKLKSTLIYVVFPIILLILAFLDIFYIILPVILLYFTVFIIFQYENVLNTFAGYYSKNEKTNKALRCIYKAYKLKQSTVQTALVFIYMLLKTGKYDKAGEIIEETEKRESSKFESHTLQTNKALYYWKKNRISDALEIYQKLVEEGETTIIYGSYGYILTLDDNLDKALEINETAYKYNPSNKAIMDNLGLTYIKTGDFDSAYKIYDELMKMTPRFPEAYYNMAVLMQRMNDINSAIRNMKKCLTMPFNGLSTITRKEAERKLDHLKRLQGSVL